MKILLKSLPDDEKSSNNSQENRNKTTIQRGRIKKSLIFNTMTWGYIYPRFSSKDYEKSTIQDSEGEEQTTSCLIKRNI